MNNRVSKDQYYLGIAESVLQRSSCLRRKYGAVIVKHDEVISTGYNGSPRGCPNCNELGICFRDYLNVEQGGDYRMCWSSHAEMNAIISASRGEMIGSTIYIVGWDVKKQEYADSSPCLLCHRMIINAGISRCVGYVAITGAIDGTKYWVQDDIKIHSSRFTERQIKLYRTTLGEDTCRQEIIKEYFNKCNEMIREDG